MAALSRLESSDYEGHSVAMLRRVANALGAKLDVELCLDAETSAAGDSSRGR